MYRHLDVELGIHHHEPLRDNYRYVGIGDIASACVEKELEAALQRMSISKVRTPVCPMYKTNAVLKSLSGVPRKCEVNFKVIVFWFFM